MSAMTSAAHPGTLITVAPTGAETTKDAFPALPTTLVELTETAVRCEAAGAAMIHLHIRDDEHRPTLETARLAAAVDAIREHTSLIVQLSTGGSVHDPLDTRLTVLDADPDSCSLTMGTVNFGDDVFLNPWPFICDLYQLTQERQVVPEFELFDLGHVAALHRLLDDVRAAVRRTRALRPGDGSAGRDAGYGGSAGRGRAGAAGETTSWSATGIGRTSLAVAFASLSAGGHLRVGMEDTLTLARGVPVRHNVELVERAARLAEIAQRPAMSSHDARELLQVKPR